VTRPARVSLVRHAPTPATRRHTFPAHEELDDRGRDLAAALRSVVTGDRVVAAPTARCRQTAAALCPPGTSVEVDRRWDELDFGAWSGRSMEQVWQEDQPALQRWLDDPRQAPTGGEPLARLVDRVQAALRELRGTGGTTVVVSSAGPIKVAVLTALSAPLRGIWNVDVAPGSVTTLHARPDGGWTVRGVNVAPRPVPARAPA
jgi:broad specificity phosphatase PhoE